MQTPITVEPNLAHFVHVMPVKEKGHATESMVDNKDKFKVYLDVGLILEWE